MAPGMLQIAVLAAGALAGLGTALGIWWLVPAQPDLRDALERLSPEHARHPANTATPGPGSEDLTGQVGRWAMTRLPAGVGGPVPARDLALLRKPVSRFYGEKVLFALLGLAIPPVLTTLFNTAGAGLPFYLPAGASLALAAVMFWLPNYNAHDDARAARTEFTRALGAYIDLVALERLSGAGPRQAMEAAAAVGDSWVFTRLAEELARTRWSGLTPWEALRALGAELALPELDDLADIMRLSGEEGAQVYTTLRARSAGIRTALLSAEKARASEVAERMTIPMSLLGVIFLAILVAPALLRVIGGPT
ncbi:type II secretion system F family protein [Phycicoccus flavus]|uniref:type II secretion system F family protein n=1 Tax=Phycicoccus flavus TaxID=2502783 RepID=UPI000FEBDA8C|nr:type II secretion system F family protein [Phycicoccus flavus]NHA68230.1 type II secretion system F family protein [Phycicoccus flavus]